MDAAAAETTQDWLLPEAARPPTIGELERRVEEALATARASEAAVMTVGAAAISAAEQAERAAGLAEKASVAALDAEGRVASVAAEHVGSLPAAGDGDGEGEAEAEGGLSDFSARADRLVERLRQLQRVPLPPRQASDAADPSQPGR